MGTTPRKHALPFERRRPLSEQDGDRLKEHRKATSIPALRNKGATHYVWIGPGDTIGGEKVEVGGFAYYFVNPADNCYFLISGAKQIVECAALWQRELTVATLPWNA